MTLYVAGIFIAWFTFNLMLCVRLVLVNVLGLEKVKIGKKNNIEIIIAVLSLNIGSVFEVFTFHWLYIIIACVIN